MFSYVGVVSQAAPAATNCSYFSDTWEPGLSGHSQESNNREERFCQSIFWKYTLSTEHGLRWLDVCHVFCCICVDRDKVEVHCNINEVGSQYPVILTKQAWPKKNLV